jgi:exonuclease VII small subunit
MVEIKTILAGVGLAKQIAGYLGLIETLNVKIDRLSKSELEAAIRSLEQANNSKNEKESLLREARNRFNKAISLEDNEKLVLAYIGLAICHKNLGDKSNFIEALRAIDKVKFKGESKYIAGAVVENVFTNGFLTLKLALGKSLFSSVSMEMLAIRKSKLEEFKNSIKEYLLTNKF